MKNNIYLGFLPILAMVLPLKVFAIEEVLVTGIPPHNDPFTLIWTVYTSGPGGGMQSPMQGAAAGYSSYEKVKHCRAAKGGGIATDVKECIKQVDLQQNFISSKCNSYGTIDWSFSYTGLYMKSSQTTPYPIKAGSHELACESLVGAVATAARTSCEISGERALQRLNLDSVCASLNP